MRRGFIWAVIGVILVALGSVGSRAAQGAYVELSPSTLLNSHAEATLTDEGGAGDTQVDNDFGDPSNPQASAQVSALHPDDGAVVGMGSASAALETVGDVFILTGEASAGVVLTEPLDGEVKAVARIVAPFSVAAGGQAVIAYDVAIEDMVQNNEKVTIELARAGASDFLFRMVFNDSAAGTLDPLGSGDYNLLLIAGAEATNRGIADEQGTARFDVILRGAVIPLPAALAPGAALLSGIAAVGWLRKRCRAG